MLNILSKRCCLIFLKCQRVLPKPPFMSKLPIKRLSVVDQALAHTSVDFFGPLLSRGKWTDLGQTIKNSKNYSNI